MLLAYGLKNYFSFREGVEVSFRLDRNCPPSISNGKSTSSIIGIKGANGSGKTHLLKGLNFLGIFCTRSFQAEPDSPILLRSFFSSTQPSEFFVEFKVEETSYRYELEATEQAVVRETLFRTRLREVKAFERIGNEITEMTSEFEPLAAMKLRQNASVISTAHQYDIKLLEDVHKFFTSIFTNVSYGGLRELPFSMETVSKFFHDYKNSLDFARRFISECDVGLSDIKIFVTEKADGEKEYTPMFYHECGGESHAVSSYGESSGTKALFRGLLLYQMTLASGGLLVLDEFDLNLHPHILPKLIKLFLDPATNPNDAQLIFSTHDSEILNMLGRYRTYLVNKQDNESFAYRLDDIPGDILRNDRPILPAYNDGKIGGVPRL